MFSLENRRLQGRHVTSFQYCAFVYALWSYEVQKQVKAILLEWNVTLYVMLKTKIRFQQMRRSKKQILYFWGKLESYYFQHCENKNYFECNLEEEWELSRG